jgi:hypothetical protein
MLGLYCDDRCIVAESQAAVDEFLGQLRTRGFEFSQEENLWEYLGIKFERDSALGTFTLTQQGFIEKIAAVTGLQNCHPNRLPAAQVALGSDPDGPPMCERWSYPSVVGRLLYLSTNTRPDIAFAVSQVARFTFNPRQSPATAVKTIIRYLWATSDKETIMKPTGELTLDMYSDTDFAGLYGSEPDTSEDAVGS